MKFATGQTGVTPTVTHLAGIRADGRPWKLTEAEVIQSIKHGVYFYVIVNHREYQVIVSRYRSREYLKTTMDRYVPELLLSLPDCP